MDSMTMTAGFTLSHTARLISVADYLAEYYDAKILDYCKVCPNFGKTWACPPYDFDARAFVAQFNHAMLIGTKAVPTAATREQSTSPEARLALQKQGIQDAWQSVRPFMMQCEQRHPGTVSLCGPFACHGCDGCSRPDGNPCKHPELMRHSLESLGFDVGKTTTQLLGIELQWASDGQLPPYLTLVTMLLSPEPLEEELSRFSKLIKL